MSYDELEKMLFITLNTKEILSDKCEKILSFYEELDQLLT